MEGVPGHTGGVELGELDAVFASDVERLTGGLEEDGANPCPRAAASAAAPPPGLPCPRSLRRAKCFVKWLSTRVWRGSCEDSKRCQVAIASMMNINTDISHFILMAMPGGGFDHSHFLGVESLEAWVWESHRPGLKPVLLGAAG